MQQLKAWFLTRTSQIVILSTSYQLLVKPIKVLKILKTFLPRPRPRLYFLSSRRLETKTLVVSRTTSLASIKDSTEYSIYVVHNSAHGKISSTNSVEPNSEIEHCLYSGGVNNCFPHNNTVFLTHILFLHSLGAFSQFRINKPCGRPPQYAPASWPLTFWSWKWCPSHVWRGLPLCQFKSS